MNVLNAWYVLKKKSYNVLLCIVRLFRVTDFHGREDNAIPKLLTFFFIYVNFVDNFAQGLKVYQTKGWS